MRDGRDGRDGVDGVGRRGERGGPGPQGFNGKSAYEIAVLRGFTGTEGEWIASLKARDADEDAIAARVLAAVPIPRDGKDAKDGDRGPPGPKGDQGDVPRHEWEGTRLRFEQGPTGEEWGEFVDLKGQPGQSGGGVAIINGGAAATAGNSWDPVGF